MNRLKSGWQGIFPDFRRVGIYTILRVNLIGLEGEGLKQIAEDARIEDCNQFEALLPRIYELGGRLPSSMVEFHNISACPPAGLPVDPSNVKSMLKVLLAAEQCAVRGYTAICDMTFGKDHGTYDPALAILHEEIDTKPGSRRRNWRNTTAAHPDGRS
jgi:ferritin-like protein